MSIATLTIMSAESRSLSRRTIAGYAIGSLGTGGFGTLPGLVLVYYLTDTLGVAALVAGLLVTLAKVWDVLIDPVIGARSDRALATTGTRRRGMILGAVLLPVFFIITFAVPQGTEPLIAGLWVMVAFILTATAFSLFQVPYIALPAEIVSGYDQRTKLISARVVVLSFAILLFGAGAPELRDAFGANEAMGYLVMAIVAGLVIGGGLLVSAFVAPTGAALTAPRSSSIVGNYREGLATLRRSAPFRVLLAAFLLQALATGVMLAGAQYVATWVLGSGVAILFASLIAPAIFFAPVWAIVSRRIGKERTFVISSLLFLAAAASLVLTVWWPGEWLYAPVALAGIGYAGMQSLPLAMLPDVISEDARHHGEGSAGIFGGVWTAGETTGMALGATVLTIVLAITGYRESAGFADVVQTPEAITGIVVAFSAVPAVLIAASLAVFARYPLRRAVVDAASPTPKETA